MTESNAVRIPVKLVTATGDELPINGLEIVSKDYLDKLALLIANAHKLIAAHDAARKTGVGAGVSEILDAIRESLTALGMPQKVRLEY